MSNYARANTGGSTHFGDKDSLTTGDNDKVIVGSQFDDEFNAILTAVNSKYDSDDLATEAQAEAFTAGKLIDGEVLLDVFQDNDGMIADIQALTGSAADGLLGWDNSASAAVLFTLEDGLSFDPDSGGVATLGIDYNGFEDLGDAGADALASWDEDTNAWIWLTFGTGLTNDGTDISLSHLGIEDLSDPNADSFLFWDETDNALNWGTPNSTSLEFNNHVLRLKDQAASSTTPIAISSQALVWDDSNLDELDMTSVSPADYIIVSDGGNLEKVEVQKFATRVVEVTTAQSFVDGDLNRFQLLTGSTDRTWTIQANSAEAIVVGMSIVVGSRDSADLEIVGDTGVRLTSVLRSGTGASGSHTVTPGGTAVITKVDTDEWMIVGNIE